ncbi:MAG: LCP family protein [Clostridia bacterium]|nr:LCP family protein [Clostridia bacterium]
MSKKDERLFNPVRVQKKGRWKFFLLGFVAFILVFGSGTLVYLSSKVDNLSIDKIMSSFEKEFQDDSAYSGKEGEATILFTSISSSETAETGKKEMYFLVLAKVNASDGSIKICPLEVKDSYIQSYESGGENEVMNAVSKDCNIKIDRFVSSDENTFALAVNYMDGLEYNVPERVEYRTKDLTLILTPGRQTIKGESLLKYLKYFKEKGLSGQADLFCAMVEDYIIEENMENPMKIYKGVLGELNGNSNISFVDTADNLDIIKIIAQKDDAKAVAVKSIEDLKS